MTSTAPPAATTPSGPGRGPRRGGIRLVIAGSLLTGSLAAAALTLVVFDSASEAAITGRQPHP